MLQVNANSWHYRIWQMGRSYRSKPHNLCKYFWHIVLKIAIAAAVVGLAVGMVVTLVWYAVEETTQFAIGIGIVAAIIAAVALAILFGKLGLEAYDRRQLVKENLPPQEPKEPSVFWLWVKAKKQKACPLIQVVDDDASD